MVFTGMLGLMGALTGAFAMIGTFVAGLLALAFVAVKMVLKVLGKMVSVAGQLVGNTAQWLADGVEGREHARLVNDKALIPAALPHLSLRSAQRALLMERYSTHVPHGLFATPEGTASHISPLTHEPAGDYDYQTTAQHKKKGWLSTAISTIFAPLVFMMKFLLAFPVLAVAVMAAGMDWVAWRARQLVAEMLISTKTRRSNVYKHTAYGAYGVYEENKIGHEKEDARHGKNAPDRQDAELMRQFPMPA